eukprot:g20621.t1
MLPGLDEEVSNVLEMPEDLRDCASDGLTPPNLPDLRQGQGYKWCSTCQHLPTRCLGFSVAVGTGISLSGYEPDHPQESVTRNPLLVVFLLLIGVPTAVFLLGVIALLMFHIFLLCAGKTTKEVLTGRRVLQGRSMFERPPSFIHARAPVDTPLDS